MLVTGSRFGMETNEVYDKRVPYGYDMYKGALIYQWREGNKPPGTPEYIAEAL
jgi:hypothetical protein